MPASNGPVVVSSSALRWRGLRSSTVPTLPVARDRRGAEVDAGRCARTRPGGRARAASGAASRRSGGGRCPRWRARGRGACPARSRSPPCPSAGARARARPRRGSARGRGRARPRRRRGRRRAGRRCRCRSARRRAAWTWRCRKASRRPSGSSAKPSSRSLRRVGVAVEVTVEHRRHLRAGARPGRCGCGRSAPRSPSRTATRPPAASAGR